MNPDAHIVLITVCLIYLIIYNTDIHIITNFIFEPKMVRRFVLFQMQSHQFDFEYFLYLHIECQNSLFLLRISLTFLNKHFQLPYQSSDKLKEVVIGFRRFRATRDFFTIFIRSYNRS